MSPKKNLTSSLLRRIFGITFSHVVGQRSTTPAVTGNHIEGNMSTKTTLCEVTFPGSEPVNVRRYQFQSDADIIHQAAKKVFGGCPIVEMDFEKRGEWVVWVPTARNPRELFRGAVEVVAA